MNKWYQEPYFDSASWLMENADKLKISNDEMLLVLYIDYASRKNFRIDINYLAAHLKKTTAEIDDYLAHLVSLSYLQISSDNLGLLFDISSIYDFEEIKTDAKDSYSLIEDLLGRPLSAGELQKTNELVAKYGDNAFIEALRIAEAYRKHSLAYVEGILRNNGK